MMREWLKEMRQWWKAEESYTLVSVTFMTSSESVNNNIVYKYHLHLPTVLKSVRKEEEEAKEGRKDGKTRFGSSHDNRVDAITDRYGEAFLWRFLEFQDTRLMEFMHVTSVDGISLINTRVPNKGVLTRRSVEPFKFTNR
ncbi:hypothetical protein Fmac_013841 [Flemingia macrophylla]|uniref:Uncharacterized protein n=1 Tax=Flemingia macrophylla TaxID=520843 RepID=A0ABD1MAT6_9FABA